MDSSVSLKDENWFLRVCHHISTGLYQKVCTVTLKVSWLLQDDMMYMYHHSETKIICNDIAINNLKEVINYWIRKYDIIIFEDITYLLTPWYRALPERLIGLQLVKKFPAFHGTRRFITALTSARYMSLSWASPFQSIYQHSTSWRSILILYTHLRLGLPSGSFPPVSPPYTPPYPYPYAPHAQPISFFSILSPARYWVRSTNHLAPCYAISFSPPLPRHS